MKITYSVMPTVLTEPLRRGLVQPDGLELVVTEPTTTDANSRDMIQLKFDVAEMSVATFAKAVERGLPLVAIPVFTSGRRFVQAGFFLSARTDVRTLDQMRGRTVGLPQYWISSCIWQRMVLQEMYGIAPADVRWVSAAPERFDDVAPPPGVELRLAGWDGLADLLGNGDVDALIMPGGRDMPPELVAATTPAFADCVAAEREYYLARKVFPLMHVTVMRRPLAQNTDVVNALLDAYRRAKDMAEARADAEWPLPPLGHDVFALRQLIGDPWPYGIGPNRVALDAFLDGAVAQGLLSRRLDIEELFIHDVPEGYR